MGDLVWADDEEENENDPGVALYPTKVRTRPDIVGMGIPSDANLGIDPALREFDDDETLAFLEKLCDGWGEYEAGMSIGWSPFLIKKFISNSDRAAIIWAIRERENESVERAIRRTAESGNPASQKLWAFNKMQHRGWADRKNITIEGGTSNEIIFSVKQGLEEKTRELVQGNDAEGIRALQEAIGLGDDPEEDIIEAVVRE